MSCPACSSPHSKATDVIGVDECRNCGAIFGNCYKGDAANFYLPYWHEGDQGEIRYIDLTMLGSEGISRFHGWINRETKRIVQVG